MHEILTPSQARLRCIEDVASGKVIIDQDSAPPWLKNLARRKAKGDEITEDDLAKEDGHPSVSGLDPWAHNKLFIFTPKESLK